MSQRVVGVVLAAGASRRAGFPKALATLNGETLLRRTCATLSAAGCDAICVVLRAHDVDNIHAKIPDGVSSCTNSRPELGMSSSLACALRDPSLADADAAVVSLLDHPLVSPDTVVRLMSHWRSSGAALVRPTFGGRGGHPYVLARQLFPGLLELPLGSDPRPFFSRFASAVEVSDPGVVDDADLPEELQALGAKPPSRRR